MALFPVLSGRANFDSSDNAATDTFSAGIRYTQAGAVRTTPDAGTVFNQGIPMSASGQVAVLDATAGLPADVTWLSGMPISGNKVCVSTNAVSAVSSGTPYDAAGAVAGSGYFIPRMLFLSGAEGVWYDPSDSATLFSDTAGTTPCAAPGAGALVNVGLMLDKSKGLVLGSELVTNGDFSQGSTGWTAGSGWVISGGSASFSAGTANSDLVQAIGLPVIGRTYRITLSQTYGSGGQLRVIYGGQFFDIPAASGFYTFILTASTSTEANIRFRSLSGTSVFSIDNISVRELPGNHAISYNSTTARPELSARVNLLTRSEEFNDGVWNTVGINAFGSGSVVNTTATLDPLGGNTAEFIQENNVASTTHGLNTAVTLIANAVYTITCCFKAATRTFAIIGIDSAGGNGARAFFNLSTGSLGTTSALGTGTLVSATTPVDAGNGWYLCQLTAKVDPAATSATLRLSIAEANGAATYSGNGTSGIFIWGADLRPANIGANVPAYQRIADQYTYDTVGFPRYLRFDGVDDGMSTPANLNLSATDKATVFAGVRKLSDAATFSVVSELSTNLNTNAGAFALYAPGSSGTYAIGATGATLQSWGLMSTYTAPITNVLSNSLNLSGANRATQIVPRVNGALVSLTGGLDSANIGGNFGTYPLYIGARNNASLWFNGYLYSLIVVGAAATAAQVSSTESWIAGKEGITL